MNLRTNCGFQKIIMAWLILVLVQLSCGGLSPTDPNIPISLNYMTGQFGQFLEGLPFIPLSATQPPLITQISPDSVSGLGGIGSGGANAELPSTQIHVYEMQLQGCGKEPVRGNLLGQTTVDAGGSWVIHHDFKPGEVVGATQISEEKESGLSNLKVNIDPGQFLILDNADELQQSPYETFQSLVLAGKSFHGACVVLQNQDIQYGRVGSTIAADDGKWKLDIPIQEGENKYRIYVQGWEDIFDEITIQGFLPQLQWPYREKNENGDDVGPDYDIPVTGFFGRNDYYVYNNWVFHDGLDIAGAEGTPVYAVADGEVFFIQFSNVGGCGGNSIYIDHGGWGSFYLHLSKITIDPNNTGKTTIYDHPIRVVAGEKLGTTGTSGLSGKQYHLHVSAFKWVKGTRQLSFNIGKSNEKSDCYIKDLKFSPWPVSRFGVLYDLNPPVDKSLGIMAYTDNDGKITPARNIISTDRLQNCVSGFDYWDVDWEQVPIKEYGPPDVFNDGVGTQFDFKGKDEKCAIP